MRGAMAVALSQARGIQVVTARDQGRGSTRIASTAPCAAGPLRSWRRNLLLWLLAVFCPAIEGRALAETYQFDTAISGNAVPVTLSVANAGGGAVDIDVAIPAGAGDLLGVFGSVANEQLVPLLSVSSSGIVTESEFGVNQVSKVGAGNTMTPVTTWDWGVRLGHAGSSEGTVTAAHFTLSAAGLTVAQLTGAATQGWVFGVRIQNTFGTKSLV